MNVRQLSAMALMGTLMVVCQVALRILPNIELVSFLVILSTLSFGWQTMWALFVFVFAEGMLYGFLPSWWVGYLIIWPGLCALTILFSKHLQKNLNKAIFSGAFGLFFGLLYAIGNIPFLGFYGALGYWVAGFPFDALHMVGNYFFMLLLGERMLNLMRSQGSWISGD
jgi:energy-coupling factor transport system substrate-specific component